ncbi:hypothetical protein AAFC00_006834 [Neodothiora populina]|uniref:Uncharacterized protein n=1 Tax=Neodothiora populina TaxID=2781224 RepID=A0ABR3PCI7_9PEZI
MAASDEPNVNFGSPCVFYDSHPEEQPTLLGSYWQALKGNLYIAWSGDVPKALYPGNLRLTWWTTDNKQGLRDYELHQHALVKLQYDSLCELPDVRRCMILGFSGQNPYILTFGQNIWQEKFKREKRANNAKWLSPEEREKRLAERQKRLDAAGVAAAGHDDDEKAGTQHVEDKKNGISFKIDELIMSNEESETQRLLGGTDEDMV